MAIDRLIFPRFEPPASLLLRAVPALRMGIGASLVVVAFTEKLASLPLALAFLDDYPLNFLPMFGLPLANSQFILAAGAVELTVGLLILFNIFVRETIVIAWLPFNLTLTIFNWVELVGHLPFYGAMAVLLVWTSGSLNQTLWVHGSKMVLSRQYRLYPSVRWQRLEGMRLLLTSSLKGFVTLTCCSNR